MTKDPKHWWWGVALFLAVAVGVSLASLVDDRFSPTMGFVAWMFAAGQAFWAGYKKRELDEGP